MKRLTDASPASVGSVLSGRIEDTAAIVDGDEVEDFDMPVSGSISTSQTLQPSAELAGGAVKVALAGLQPRSALDCRWRRDEGGGGEACSRRGGRRP